MDPDFPYSDPTFPVSPGSRTDVDRNVGRSLSAPPTLPGRSIWPNSEQNRSPHTVQATTTGCIC